MRRLAPQPHRSLWPIAWLAFLLAALAWILLGGRPAQAAPHPLPSLGVIPGSGPPGMSVTLIGAGWTPVVNPNYVIFWEVEGGLQLGTFNPDSSGNWSQSVTIPGGASPGAHIIRACEGYNNEFKQCANATFTVVVATATSTPTRTRTPSPSPTPIPPGVTPRTSTPTRTATSSFAPECVDGVERISPLNSDNLGGVAVVDLVMDVVLGDPAAQHVRIFTYYSHSEVYTQWPDPPAGTTVEAVPDAVEPNRWRLTVRDYPVRLGYNQIKVDITPSCWRVGATYYQVMNGVEPTGTPRPDVCGGLGLPAEATVINFETSLRREEYFPRLAGETGVRFETSLQVIDPTAVEPRSGWKAGASVEGLEFGSSMLPIRMAFDRPLQALGFYLGLPDAIWARGEITAVLSAYGYRGGAGELVLLGTDATSFPAAPTDVIHCLRYSAAEGDLIARALVEYTDSSGVSIAERRLIDDLTLVFAEAELPEDRPPVVEITAPSAGAALPGATVGLRATIREDRELASVRYQIDGGSETPVGAYPSLTDPAAYFTAANLSAALISPGVPHTLSVTAWDRAGQFGTDSVTIILPTPPPTIDIQAVKMEVVQVVQCLDNVACTDNAVPMLVGKPTWVRVYVRAEGGTPRRAISGRLCRGRVAACDTAYVNPLSRILPDGDADPVASDRARVDASLNFIVPPVWLTEGTLEMTAFVNYHEEDMDETRSDNNAVQAGVTVLPPRALTVMFMPVTADGMTAPISEMWNFADWLARVFPVARINPVARAPLPGNFDLSDSSGDGCGRTWNRLMDSLRSAYSWGGSGTAYLFGLVPGEANTDGVGGCGEVPGRVASGITSGGTRWGPVIAAQELGHNFGRRHATGGCNADNPDGSYPRAGGLLDDWGLDLVLRQPYPSDSSYDYMGYCGGEGNSWTSVYTYLALLRTLPVAAAGPSGARLAALMTASGEPQLIGGGQISAEGFTLDHGFYRAALAQDIEDGLPPGPFRAQLLDAAGGILYEREFGLIELSNRAPADAGHFLIFLPDLPGAAQIAFRYRDTEVGRVTASPGVPEVRIVSPAGGEDWGDSGLHPIAWEASDPDGDVLSFNVVYSADDGQSWSAIELDRVAETSISVDAAALPGGRILFRVLASDGLNTAESRSAAPVTVAAKPPMVHLASPKEGDWFPTGEAVVFRGYAADLEDIVLEDGAFVWTSDRDGELGSGPTLWAVPLREGQHTISLAVTDREGRSVTQSVHVTVGGEPGQPPGRSVAATLLLAGGALLLVSAGGIAFFLLRGRRRA